MDRKNFIKKTLIAELASSIIPAVPKAKNSEKSTYDKLIEQVGFNHLPNKKIIP